MNKWILLFGVFVMATGVWAQPPCTDNTGVSENQTICSGSSPNQLEITGNTSGLSFQWESSTDNINFTTIGGENNSTLTVSALSSDMFYRAEISGMGGCTTAFSDTISITVQEPPSSPPTAISGIISPVCTGTSLELTASGGNSGDGADYQWGTGTISDINVEFTGNPFSTDDLSDNTTFWVRLKGNTACDNETTAFTQTVTVNDPPTAPTGISVAENPVCNGDMANLTATGGNEGSGSDYEWGWGNQVGVNLITTTDNNSWQPTSLTSDTTFWVRRFGTSSCSDITEGTTQLVNVRPLPSISITNPGELCQLPEQPVEIINETALELDIQWSSASGESGTLVIAPTETEEVELDLSNSGANSNFIISSYGFADQPNCAIVSPENVQFTVKPRPPLNNITNTDSDLTGNNPFCQGYGPVEFNVEAPEGVTWQAQYLIGDEIIETEIIDTPFNLAIDSVGDHEFIVNEISYVSGLGCTYDPSEFETSSYYSEEVTIKPTPPKVEFIDGAPSILEFCNYVNPLNDDSVARVSDLNIWISNNSGYNIEWVPTNNNSAISLPNSLALNEDEDYYPIFEQDGCHSMLDEMDNDSNTFFIISLLPLPDLSESILQFPDSICSGNSFEMLFEPAVSISHYSISNFSFSGSLSSPNITDTISYENTTNSNFTISNNSATDTTWTATIFAQNKNISQINPVTCWSDSVHIEILINPNATLTPASTTFGACQDGANIEIDPEWNGIGQVEWDFGDFPAPTEVVDSSQVVSIDISSGMVPVGMYSLNISGGYQQTSCTVDTNFTVNIYSIPEFETRILDVDNTICHNEYTHIEIANPNDGYDYEWSCSGCETDDATGTSFLPHWNNPEPTSGTWIDGSGKYSITATDTTTGERCSNSQETEVNIIADYASCPEGIDFFEPNGLSLVDVPAKYFRWYNVEAQAVFSEINGATDQTYFPNEDIDGCDTANYIVASSLYADRCWSTTVNCFKEFGLRECDGPKSKSNASEFLLYPNPASGRDIVLENLNLELNGRYAIDLFDLTGKNLMSEIIQIRTVGNNPIELPHLVSGVYLFRVSNPNYTQSFKLVIN